MAWLKYLNQNYFGNRAGTHNSSKPMQNHNVSL